MFPANVNFVKGNITVTGNFPPKIITHNRIINPKTSVIQMDTVYKSSAVLSSFLQTIKLEHILKDHLVQ